jgi:hypothetical protein
MRITVIVSVMKVIICPMALAIPVQIKLTGQQPKQPVIIPVRIIPVCGAKQTVIALIVIMPQL